MTNRSKKVAAVLPAYNASRTLKQTVADIPPDWVDEIILVDDASTDDTVNLARQLNLHVVVHDQNRGYGGNQKTCYTTALARGADIVVMVHPDHQYDPKAIPALIQPLLNGTADAVFGSRMMIPRNALAGGMPIWKFIGNVLLTKLANLRLGLHLTEYHSGFRAYSRQVLATLPLNENSDGFVFDTEIILQLLRYNFRIVEVPIATSYFPEASSVSFSGSVRYGFDILSRLWRYRPAKEVHRA
jgi:glycosyltransferase involved in cell wall biosynthesis